MSFGSKKICKTVISFLILSFLEKYHKSEKSVKEDVDFFKFPFLSGDNLLSLND